jgi:SET domain-containing protein
MTNIKMSYNPTLINPIEEFTEVKPSKIHGLGLYAKKFMPKGTVWWHAREKDVLIVTKDQFQTLDSSAKSSSMENYITLLLTYSYYERDFDALVFCLDNCRYVNHSPNPNSGTPEDESPFRSVALRDIQVGEELTEDYLKYTICNWLKKYDGLFDPTCW